MTPHGDLFPQKLITNHKMFRLILITHTAEPQSGQLDFHSLGSDPRKFALPLLFYLLFATTRTHKDE